MIFSQWAPVGAGGKTTVNVGVGQLAKRAGMATIAAMAAALARAGTYDEGAVGFHQAGWLVCGEEGCEPVQQGSVGGAASQTPLVGVRSRNRGQRSRPSGPPASGRRGGERASHLDV
jgi:hypothetical protein